MILTKRFKRASLNRASEMYGEARTARGSKTESWTFELYSIVAGRRTRSWTRAEESLVKFRCQSLNISIIAFSIAKKAVSSHFSQHRTLRAYKERHRSWFCEPVALPYEVARKGCPLTYSISVPKKESSSIVPHR